MRRSPLSLSLSSPSLVTSAIVLRQRAYISLIGVRRKRAAEVEAHGEKKKKTERSGKKTNEGTARTLRQDTSSLWTASKHRSECGRHVCKV